MNVGTHAAVITIYQWAYNGNDGAAKDLTTNLNWLPSRCWQDDILEGMGNNPDLAIQGMNYYPLDQRVYPTYTRNLAITQLGIRPQARSRHSKHMDANYRLEKLDTISLQPGQTVLHNVFLPGFYVSARDLLFGERFRHKQRTLMFIINGELAFEGATETTAAHKIGTSSVFINYEIETDCVAQTVPHNRPQTTYICNEDLASTDDRDYTVNTATSIRTDTVKMDVSENVDDATAVTDNAER